MTSWVRPKDVPIKMRPLALHIGPHRDVHVRKFFGDDLRTSLGCNFAEWEVAKETESVVGAPDAHVTESIGLSYWLKKFSQWNDLTWVIQTKFRHCD